MSSASPPDDVPPQDHLQDAVENVVDDVDQGAARGALQDAINDPHENEEPEPSHVSGPQRKDSVTSPETHNARRIATSSAPM